MASTTIIPVRAARDWLIDILGFGATFPLRDLDVRDEHLMVTFGMTARIPVEDSQKDVCYQLKLVTLQADGTTKITDASAVVQGTGGEILLETLAGVQDDTTFSILAIKLRDPDQQAYLHHLASVRVGLSTMLTAHILNPDLLDPYLSYPSDNAPRLVDYGSRVKVQLDSTQEGVDYRLVCFNEDVDWEKETPAFTLPSDIAADLDRQVTATLVKLLEPFNVELGDYARIQVDRVGRAWTILGSTQSYRILAGKADRLNGYKLEEIVLSTPDVRGDLQAQTLDIPSVSEDIDIRIRATKIFDPSEHRPTQTALLSVVLPLKVRASTGLRVTAKQSVVDFKAPATITISATQKTAVYRLFVRAIPDRDFVHRRPPPEPVLTVSVGANEPDAQIVPPLTGGGQTLPGGYVSAGAAKPGTGGDLTFTTEALTDDSLFIVQARKNHQVPGQEAIPSFVQLAQATAILVRPDAAPGLCLRAAVTDGKISGDLEVSRGQPGVFYYLRRDPSTDDLGFPAYFHKHDDDDPHVNKGLGQLTTEVDFVIARPHSPTADTADLARLPAEIPRLTLDSLKTDQGITVFAKKAQTRVSTLLKDTFQFRSGPAIAPVSTSVIIGRKAQLKITASRVNEKYQINPGATPPGDCIAGTGGDLILETSEVLADTSIELLIQQTDSSILVERLRSFAIQAIPDISLTIRAVDPVVAPNATTQIQIGGSQHGIQYQLMADQTAVGEPLPGNGSTLSLPTGPLTVDTTFTVLAAKIDAPEKYFKMENTVSVKVAPNPKPNP